MAFKDLRDFVAFLEEKGDLRRIGVPVDPELEMTEITDRVIKSGGPALLFENVIGYDMPGAHQHLWHQAANGLGAGRRTPRRAHRARP